MFSLRNLKTLCGHAFCLRTDAFIRSQLAYTAHSGINIGAEVRQRSAVVPPLQPRSLDVVLFNTADWATLGGTAASQHTQTLSNKTLSMQLAVFTARVLSLMHVGTETRWRQALLPVGVDADLWWKYIVNVAGSGDNVIFFAKKYVLCLSTSFSFIKLVAF